MFEFEPLVLQGAYRILMPRFADERGSFVKVFQESFLKNQLIDFDLKESYFSISKKGVIRGMHFQNPPYDHSKIVFCPLGCILDVIIDLRAQSLTYGQYVATELSDKNHTAYYIPKGFAHGFKALTEGAMTYYLVSSEHNAANDNGIRFDSFGMDWQEESPVFSQRDGAFPMLKDWKSCF